MTHPSTIERARELLAEPVTFVSLEDRRRVILDAMAASDDPREIVRLSAEFERLLPPATPPTPAKQLAPKTPPSVKPKPQPPAAPTPKPTLAPRPKGFRHRMAPLPRNTDRPDRLLRGDDKYVVVRSDAEPLNGKSLTTGHGEAEQGAKSPVATSSVVPAGDAERSLIEEALSAPDGPYFFLYSRVNEIVKLAQESGISRIDLVMLLMMQAITTARPADPTTRACLARLLMRNARTLDPHIVADSGWDA